MTVIKKTKKILLRLTVYLMIFVLTSVYIVVRPGFLGEQQLETITVDPAALKKHVKHLSENLSPRNYQNTDNLNATAEYIEIEMKKHSNQVSFQTYQVNDKLYTNVIAKFGPSTNDLIVVGAHYDVMGEYAGADDNASGVAGLIELGRLLSQSELKNSIELVAYTLEEPPYFASQNMGSYVHAESVKNRNVELMISLEMIGYFSDDENSQYFPISLMKWVYPTKGNFISIVDQVFSNAASGLKNSINKYTDMPAYSTNAPVSIEGIDFSDHRNYWKFGFPAVMVTDTSFYRNDNYHTAEDTYEKLDYQAMAKVVYGVFKHIVDLDSE
jgi:Zn-dependent M28 family amino/carboxypeptidase